MFSKVLLVYLKNIFPRMGKGVFQKNVPICGNTLIFEEGVWEIVKRVGGSFGEVVDDF